MKQPRRLLCVLVFFFCCQLPVSAGQASGFTRRDFAAANNAFACALYKKIAAPDIVVSPYGVAGVFAMAYAGAEKRTAGQLSSVFGFPADREALGPAYAEFQAALPSAQGQGVTMITANSLWPMKGRALRPQFTAALRDYYSASVTALDYAADPSGSARTINSWALTNTGGRIRDLLPPDRLDRQTRLVLANAVYFKGLWAVPFRKQATAAFKFHTSGGTDVSVQGMRAGGRYLYFGGDKTVQALELPYKGGDFAMLVLLPRRLNGLALLQEKLSPEFVGRLRAGLSEATVNLWLPKFTAQSDLSLNAPLAALGAPDVFSPAEADFSGMDGGRLYVSAAVQKAFIEVNEEGTEAAAASATAMLPGSAAAPEREETFRADHPFLYIVLHRPTGAILFAGNVSNPR